MQTCRIRLFIGYGILFPQNKGGIFIYTEITGRTEAAVTQEIITRAARAYRETHRRTLILIPDQFAFEYEKKLYQLLGPESNNIVALGINHLCKQIELENRHPGESRTSAADADDPVRVLLMERAVRRMRTEKTAQHYTKSLDKGYFVSEVLTIIDELRQTGTTSAELEIAAAEVEGSVRNKAADIARLYRYYEEELQTHNLCDRGGIVQNATQIAAKSGYFTGCEVFMDRYRSLTLNEIRLISVILGQAQNTCAGFLAPETDAKVSAEISPFSLTIRIAANIRAAAAALSLPMMRVFAEPEGLDPAHPAIEHIRKNLYSIRPQTTENTDDVRIFRAQDAYEECEFVCADIHRLRRETGCKPEEIAVICRALSAYAPALETAAERYELPIFLDTDYPVRQSSLMLYLSVLSELLCANSYNTEQLLRYMKSPLSNFKDSEVSRIEEYCVTWNVHGELWTSPFTVTGIAKKESSEKYLKKLNEVREKLIVPIETFRKAVADEPTAAKICAAFYQLLDTQNLTEKAYSAVSRAAHQEDAVSVELASDFRQIWTAFLTATDTILHTLGEEPMRPRRFFDILRVMLSQLQVSSPPQKLGAIICADAERSRLDGIRYAYVIGVNEGVFPQPPPNSGLFTGHDRKLLDKAKIKLLKNSDYYNQIERLSSYLALSGAPEGICVSYVLSDEQGKKMRPSRLIGMLHGMFPTLAETDISSLPLEFFCTGKKAAFYAYVTHTDAPPEQKAAIRTALSADEAYKRRFAYLDESSKGKEHKLDAHLSEPLFFPDDFWASASKADVYYHCPFQYFCRYGMKLYSPSPADLNPLNTGNLIHGLLEELMSQPDSTGKKIYNANFVGFSKADLQNKISVYFQNYIHTELGGSFGKTQRFYFMLERLKSTALDVVQNIQTELKNSDFVPTAFEYNLVKNGQSLLEIEIDPAKNLSVKLSGKIDRVDIYTDKNGVEWVKIVDYKTGTKELRLEDVYNGQNLQMLLYLLALTANITPLNPNQKLRPAGIVYMPAGAAQDYSKKPNDTSPAAVQTRKLASYQRNGLVTESEDIFTAMDGTQSGWFSPGTENKAFTTLSEPMIKAAAEFAQDKIREFGESLINGEISAKPVGSGTHLPCAYCEFAEVCGKYRRPDAKIIVKEDSVAFIAELEKRAPSKGGKQP